MELSVAKKSVGKNIQLGLILRLIFVTNYERTHFFRLGVGMENLIEKIQKIISGLGLVFLWFMLCGIDRSNTPSFSTSDLETSNLFQSMPPPSTWPISFWITLFVLVFGSVGGFFGVKYLREKQAQEELDAIVDEQAQLGLDTELENKNIEQEARDFLEVMCGTSDPVDLLPVISSSELFEETAQEFKDSERFDEELLPQLYDLRRSLELSLIHI